MAKLFVAAGLMELWMHWYPMHDPKFLGGSLKKLYNLHAGMHHDAYETDTMPFQSTAEWSKILMPPPAIIGLVLMVCLLCMVPGAIWGARVGWIALWFAGAWIAVYEMFHLVVHTKWCPDWARRHHARHHHKKLMARYLMAVTPMAQVMEYALFGVIWAACLAAGKGRPDMLIPSKKLLDELELSMDTERGRATQ